MNLETNLRDVLKKNGLIVCLVESMMMGYARCNACYEAFSGRFNASTVQDAGEDINVIKQSEISEPTYTGKVIGKGSGMGPAMVYSIMPLAILLLVVNLGWKPKSSQYLPTLS